MFWFQKKVYYKQHAKFNLDSALVFIGLIGGLMIINILVYEKQSRFTIPLCVLKDSLIPEREFTQSPQGINLIWIRTVQTGGDPLETLAKPG
jgi:hypothetical protein